MNNNWDIGQKIVHFFTSPIRTSIRCDNHCGGHCTLPQVDVDCSGFPCTDFAPSGLQQGVHGKTFIVILGLLAYHRSRRTRLLFMENVPEFPIEVIRLLMGDLYDVHHFYVSPADAGFEFLNRMRLFMFCILRGLGHIKGLTILKAIEQTLKSNSKGPSTKHLKTFWKVCKRSWWPPKRAFERAPRTF